MRNILLLLFCSVSATLSAINLKVGETYTLSIGYVSHLQGCQWTISRPGDVEFVSSPQSYSTQVTIRAVKGFPSTSPCIVQCKYYYLELDPMTGRYIYSRTGFQDWYIFVDEVKPTGIYLSPQSLTMYPGESQMVYATITPSNAADNSLTWRSNNTSVATFFKTQNDRISVYAEGSGEAKITATTSNGYSATCYVRVIAKEVTGVSLSNSSISLNEGSTKTLTANITPSGATTTLTWSSDDPNIATVSNVGVVKGISGGTTVVRVKTSNGYSASCKVSVTPLPISVSLPATVSVSKGATLALTPTLSPSNATTTYTWSSENTKTATVSTSGVVTGIEPGTVNITVKTSNNKSAVCKVTVKEPVDPTSVELDKKTAQIALGYNLSLKPILKPSDATTSYTWTSSDTSLASVTSTGSVKGLKEGEVTIMVKTKNGKTSTCKVNIFKPSEKSAESRITPKISSLKALIDKSLKQIK